MHTKKIENIENENMVNQEGNKNGGKEQKVQRMIVKKCSQTKRTILIKIKLHLNICDIKMSSQVQSIDNWQGLHTNSSLITFFKA